MQWFEIVVSGRDTGRLLVRLLVPRSFVRSSVSYGKAFPSMNFSLVEELKMVVLCDVYVLVQ